jgi:hypothetical protein
MAFGDSAVNGRAIIRAVGGHRNDVAINPIAQLWNLGNVAHIVRRQFRDDNSMRVRINTEVQKLWGDRGEAAQDIDIDHRGDRLQQTFGLAQRADEIPGGAETGLDSDR